MLRYTSSPHILALPPMIAFGFVMSACGGAAPVASDSPSSHTAMHSPTVTPLSMHSMRVDVGGYRLYMRCMGQGSPTVIFDAGLGEDASTWDHVQPEVAQFTQACAYDRANVAPSGSRPATI